MPRYMSLTVTPDFEDSHFPSNHSAIIVLKSVTETDQGVSHITNSGAYDHYQFLGLVILYSSSDMHSLIHG